MTRKGPNRDQYVQFVPMAESEEEYVQESQTGEGEQLLSSLAQLIVYQQSILGARQHLRLLYDN